MVIYKMHFNYANIFFAVAFSLIYSISFILIGVFLIKREKKKMKGSHNED
jgi:ABC-type sugar transport system permease subunit